MGTRKRICPCVVCARSLITRMVRISCSDMGPSVTQRDEQWDRENESQRKRTKGGKVICHFTLIYLLGHSCALSLSPLQNGATSVCRRVNGLTK